jgi:hypothetical protein
LKNSAALVSLTLAVTLSGISSPALAWGERGHDAVTRVATRILANSKDPDSAKFGAFLQKRENMLGHLSNVPDIVWKSVSPELDKLSSPSHFVDLDFILQNDKLPTAAELPQDVNAFVKALDKNCAKKSKDFPCVGGKTVDEKLLKAGHGPYRVQTLAEDLREAFKNLKAMDKVTKDSPEFPKKEEAVQRILLLSGVLSHFVGDLANPHHTSADYDGWQTEQGGLHAYFETDILDSLGLDLEATVLDEAERHQPMAKLFQKHPHNYLEQAWELTLDSHAQITELTALDRDNSLLQKSSEEKEKGPDGRSKRERAKRKEPVESRNVFRNLVVLRLAAGSDALARIWLDTWQEAGKPDLSFYRNYHYDVKPEFIPMRYLPGDKG